MMAPEEYYMSDYDTPNSVKRLEAELAELERELNPPQEEGEETGEEVQEQEVTTQEVETEEPAPANKDEETYKKRYSDLRRHSQKLADKIKELEASLSSRPTTTGLPSLEEAKAWAEANPKAASVIRAIAAQETSVAKDELDAVKGQLYRTEQEARILKAHPDFEAITSNSKFHDWAESQPESVQKLIYSSSADEVIWAINSYKDKHTVDKSDPKKEAAKAVPSKSSSVEPKNVGKGRFTESMVNKMSVAEYETYEVDIAAAMRDGTFVYDLSGAAR